jgi:hypothetical protein
LRNWYDTRKNYKTFLVYNGKLSERGCVDVRCVPFTQVGERHVILHVLKNKVCSITEFHQSKTYQFSDIFRSKSYVDFIHSKIGSLVIDDKMCR